MPAAICAGGLEPKITRALGLRTLADEVMEIPGVERFVDLHEFLGISGASVQGRGTDRAKESETKLDAGPEKKSDTGMI